jgi:putative transposase
VPAGVGTGGQRRRARPKILKVFNDHYQVSGAGKLWRQLRREGELVGRDRVARLMRTLGIAGAVPARPTAPPSPIRPRPGRRTWSPPVHRDAAEPALGERFHLRGHLVRTVSVAFVIDVFSRLLVGWRAAASMRTELVLDALEMAIWRRVGVLDGLVCHSDAGSQYTSLRYTTRLAEIGAAPSIGTVGDSDDNSLAESTIGLFKTELIRRRGPWRTSRRSNSPPWATSTGSTTTDSTVRSATSHPLNSRPPTIANRRQPPRPETNRRSLYRTQTGSVAFLQTVLGLTTSQEASDFVAFQLPEGGTFEVFGPGDQDHQHFSIGPVVGLVVEDLTAAVRELEAAGVELLGGQMDERGGGWRHFRAPDGNVYELTSG